MRTSTYRVTGRLIVPVNNVQAARLFLRSKDMEEFLYPEYLKASVHTARWDLIDADTWEVIVVTIHRLAPSESKLLSEWISGQNSDGLGEGFEQQPFAEHDSEDAYAGECEFLMSSFDWQTNDCTLELIK